MSVLPQMNPPRSFLPCLLLAGALAIPSSRLSAGVEVDSLSLNGSWRFALDRADEGERDGWFGRELTGTIRLPGALQAQGFGDDISTNTAWTGSLNDRSWFSADRYAPYRQPGNVKVPFWLQPAKHYVGVAWYQKEIRVPGAWNGRRLVVQLERPHWSTALWLDDRLVGRQDGLGTPHEYDLGIDVPAGTHRLTLRVDNRLHVPVGPDAHSVSDHTQGNWNGVAGELKLLATAPVWIDDIQVFPEVATSTARVRVTLGNATGRAGSGTLQVRTRIRGAASGRPLAALQVPMQWDPDGGTAGFTIELGPDAPRWDEFHPALHELTLEIPGVTAPRTVTFGLREVRVVGSQLTVNGRPVFLRGTLECAIFPLTGYPPTDVASWKRILRIAREHGLNHLRFHSWCPPEAAFVAADEMGFYYQVECSAWSSEFNQGTALDPWIYSESERIVKARGNHPSFLLMAPSNEPGGPGYEPFLARFVEHWKAKDDRRLYTAGSGWPSHPANEFHVTPGARAYPVHSARDGRNATDYREFLARQNRPVISHEIGQYCVFPNLDEIPKYRGLFRARNFEIVRDFLVQAGLAGQSRDFLRASGRLQTLFYKDEIEACLRTPGWAGFQLLDLHDFPGQGTALVGVLDAFWDEKGYVTPDEYRRFCDETVPLARLEKRVWTTDETFRAALEVAHFGPHDLSAAKARWVLREAGGRTVAEGGLPAGLLPTGKVTPLGAVELPLSRFTRATALNLEVRLEGTRFVNDWNFWVYPATADVSVPEGVTVTSILDEQALATLEAGGRVVMLADPGTVRGSTTGRFDPIFWNRLWFPSQPQHTLGLLLNPKHPALAGFPTAFHADWQWQDLQNRSRPIPLDHLPRELRPVVQVIDDWNTCRKLGLVIEARVGNGRVLIGALDLTRDLETRPAARQLRRSLLDYAASSRFRPKARLEVEQLRSLFREPGLRQKLGARVIRANSAMPGHEAAQILDGNPQTLWHTAWGDGAPDFPHEVVIAFDHPATLEGLTLLPRADGQNGWIRDYAVYLSLDDEQWGEAVAQGQLDQNAAGKEIRFEKPATGKYLKFVAQSSFDARQPYASLAELDLIAPAR
ncbi:MAG: discoidin domain-containing protein [Limisphaerales bacterium]